jgi:glycosyltransferase involved in cell wall biosynthesis
LKSLEIILPLRNPPEALCKTVDSLVNQTDRGFSVLLSDNFSSKGLEILDAAAARFLEAGISVRRVRPPYELGRVEHWNWAHYAASGEWLKPVFAGDWLDLEYVAKLRAAVAANTACRYAFASFVYHTTDAEPKTVSSPWAGRFHPAEEMSQLVLSHGMQFGPPSAAAYERRVFIESGGYATHLPICADSLFFCTLASCHGVLGIADPLCHFNIHAARFSTSLKEKRNDTFRETMTYYFMLAYHAWTRRVAIPKTAYLRMLLREARSRRRAT